MAQPAAEPAPRPKTLETLAAERLNALDSVSWDTVPDHLRALSARALFAAVVAQAADSSLFDDYVGWTAGPNAVMQHKDYVQSNIRAYERAYSRGQYNQLFPKVDYVLYYLRQEPDFETRYPQRGPIKADDLVPHL